MAGRTGRGSGRTGSFTGGCRGPGCPEGLATGQSIIVEDIKIMYMLARILERRIPSLRSFDPLGLVQNFEESILKELEYDTSLIERVCVLVKKELLSM